MTDTTAHDTAQSSDAPTPTGIEGLDHILRGGLPMSRVYLVQGEPGTGKTTLALQFLLAGAARGEPVLYVALGETVAEIKAVARSHGWSLDHVDVCDLHGPDQLTSDAQYTFFHPSEVELTETTKSILAYVERVKPRRVVLDSLSELRLIARDSLRYRRQVLTINHHLTTLGCTVLLLDTMSHPGAEFQLQTVAHGVISLEQKDPAYGGKRRRLAVQKVRGVPFHDGYHDYVIGRGGLRVYPRLSAQDHTAAIPREVSSGNAQLDAMLGGGIETSSSTLIVGPSGVGKSTLAMTLAEASLARGEPAAVYLFDEGRTSWMTRAQALGFTLHERPERELLVRAINPAEMSPGAFAHLVHDHARERGAKLVVIDSVNGYNEAMPEERFLSIHMHELLSSLSLHGVATVLVLATIGAASGPSEAPIDLSYIADSILALRYFEAFGEVRKAISVLKKRMSAHETTIRELEIAPAVGIRVGRKLLDFRGVLTGAPEFTGGQGALLDHADGAKK